MSASPDRNAPPVEAAFLHVHSRRLWNSIAFGALAVAAVLVWVLLPPRHALALKGLLALTSVMNRFVILAPLIEDGIPFSPYFLAAAYSLKLALTGESYEGETRGVQRKEGIIAGIACVYTLFLFDAAGLEFLLLSAVILAPASMLYVKARSESGLRLFSPTEIGLFLIIVASAVVGVVGLWTGRITL